MFGGKSSQLTLNTTQNATVQLLLKYCNVEEYVHKYVILQ